MYRTLKDAYEVTNDPRFLSGKTQIWYYKRSESRDFGMGSFGLERSGKWPSVENLSLTHVFIGFVDESNPSKVFQMMQGEYWSPNGEASTLAAFILRMAGHTSMSVGDIIVFPGSKALMVDMAGFYDLADAPVSPRMASMRTLTASDRSALIKLASSLPAGSPDRKAILASLDKTANQSSALADSLKKKWRNVTYDPKQNQGRASLGALKITFRESGNDNAVIVTINEMPYLKTDAESAEKILDAINDAFRMA